jgi:hypothetical protein
VFVIGALLTACASLPGVPAGPARPGASFGLAYAYAYGAADARVTRTPAGENQRLRGNSEMYGGSAPLAPLRAMARYSPASFIDFGADLGWLDLGLQLRAGQLDATRRIPWGFELEWRTGQTSLFRASEATRARSYRGRLEAYPRLGTSGDVDVFGVLTLGASTGTWVHYLPAPKLDTTEDGFGSALELRRAESRLELSVGVHGRGPRAALTLAFLPWLVLDHLSPRQDCTDCGFAPRSMDLGWGFGVALSGSLALTRDERAPAAK